MPTDKTCLQKTITLNKTLLETVLFNRNKVSYLGQLKAKAFIEIT